MYFDERAIFVDERTNLLLVYTIFFDYCCTMFGDMYHP